MNEFFLNVYLKLLFENYLMNKINSLNIGLIILKCIKKVW